MWLDRLMRRRVEALKDLETEGLHIRAATEDAEHELEKKIKTEQDRMPIASAIIWRGHSL